MNAPQHVISASYGNDSIALIQWALERGICGAHVVYADTGWSSPEWPERVDLAEKWVKSIGYTPVRIRADAQFADLMRSKKGFPSQRYQWCSGWLKGLPFLEWIDEFDPGADAVVMIGKRRDESAERADTPEFIGASKYHGGRRVWHPLYAHDAAGRNDLLARAGWDPLPHRSMECSPCINANKSDLRALCGSDVEKTAALEAEVGKTMFRPKKHGGATGIVRVIEWSNSRRGKYDDRQEVLFSGCASGYCGT